MSAPLTLQALALTVLFFLKALHRASAVSMAIRDFLLVAFLCVMVSENLLKMQGFKGSLDFSCLESHKLLIQECRRNSHC